MIGRMKPLFVRPLTDDERAALRAGLRSPDAFTLRRCQALLASADGLRPAQIAERFGCASQSVRNAIRAFAAEGTDCLREKSHRPASVRYRRVTSCWVRSKASANCASRSARNRAASQRVF